MKKAGKGTQGKPEKNEGDESIDRGGVKGISLPQILSPQIFKHLTVLWIHQESRGKALMPP